MKALDFVLNQPWAITADALATIESIAERANESVEAVVSRIGRPLDNTRTVQVIDGVAVVPVEGPVARYMNLFTEISGGTSIEVLARDIRAAADDPKVRAIVLSFDSPGGTVTGTAELSDQIAAARASKPVVAYVGGMACSAAYWMASACSEIVADSTAFLGSIGVRAACRVPSKDGSRVEFVSTDSPDKVPDVTTEHGKSLIQAQINDVYGVFAGAVARNRGVSAETVRSDFGRGDVLIASKAIAAGMADRLGSLDGLIAELSRGEWKAPEPKSPPARKAAVPQPRRAAMSEPNQTAAAAPTAEQAIDYKALHEQEVNKRIAAEQAVKAEVDKRLDASADAYVRSLSAGKDAVFTPGEAADRRAEFLQAARDDHERPVAGKPRFRQEALEQAHAKRKPHGLTTEQANADEATKTRAMSMDPAEANATSGKEAADREERRRLNEQAVQRRQGRTN